MLLLRTLVRIASLISLGDAFGFGKQKVDNFKSEAANITFSVDDRFQGTIARFFKDQFEEAKDSPVFKDDEATRNYKIPKLDANLLRWGSFMFSFWAAAANAPRQQPGQTLTCGDQECGYLEELGLKTYERLLTPTRKSPLWINQQGIVVVDDPHEMVLVFLKGAPTWRQFRAVLTILPRAGKSAADEFGIKGAQVHRGLRAAVDQVYPLARAAVERAHADRPDHTIVVGGQSMGGATAILLAARLRSDRDLKVSREAREGMKVFSSGAPRCGNKAFDEGVQDMFPDLVRFTNAVDDVPGFPPTWMGFSHTPVEVWMQKAFLAGSESGEKTKKEKKKKKLSLFSGSGKKKDTGITIPQQQHPDLTFPTRLCTGYNNERCGAMPVRKLVVNNPNKDHFEFFGHTRLAADTHSSLLGGGIAPVAGGASSSDSGSGSTP